MRLAAIVAATVIAALLLGGCGGEDGAGDRLRVGYAFGTDLGDTADLLAYETLRAEGFDVEIVSTGSAENAVAALRSRSVDVAVIDQASALQAIAQEAELVAILGQNMVSEAELVARGQDSVAGLRGQRVRVGRGTEGEALVRAAALEAGLPADAVGVQTVPESTARAVGLRAGRIDAAVLDASDVIRLRAELPDLRVLARAVDAVPIVGRMVFVTRPSAAAADDRVRRLVDAVLDAAADLRADGGRSAFVRLARSTGFESDGAELLGRIHDYYRSVAMWPDRERPVTRAEYERTVAALLRQGRIEQAVPFERAWDTTYWREQ